MTLPVLEKEGDIRVAVQNESGRLLLKAPTGSGKSTTVPGMIADEVEGLVIVLQPRRMAARLLAGFVARQRGTPLGQEVGYAVRHETKRSQTTRILFMTDGVFQRMLAEDPELNGVGAVIFDEFHERRMASDLALGRVLDLQETVCPDLKLVVMSATLEIGDLAGYLEPATVIETAGRLFPVEISHRAPSGAATRQRARSADELWDRVAKAVREVVDNVGSGERVLVFLPGVYEIRRCESLLSQVSWLSGWDVQPLYSALSPSAQENALRQDSSRRIILATNVAETSVTIEGVRVVIDSGLARKASYDPARGFDSLRVSKISQAAAAQRAGRAGRTGPGRCLRLWSESDHRVRAEFETPEIHRLDLAEALLLLKRLGYAKTLTFRWLDAPKAEAITKAEMLLSHLGALDSTGHLTEGGWEMSRWPLHPRLTRFLMAGVDFGCAAECAFVAAALQGEGIFKHGGKGKKWSDFADDPRELGHDFAAEWNAAWEAKTRHFRSKECTELGVLARGARETWQSFEQLCCLLERRGVTLQEVHFARHAERVARALLTAFSDRLAIRRDQGSTVCHLLGGRRAKLDPRSATKTMPLFLATEMTEIEGRERAVILSRCAAIDEKWLSDAFPGELQSATGVIFDEEVRRVVAVRQKIFRDLVLEEKRGGEVDPDLAGELLARRVMTGELKVKKWDGKVERWIKRLRFLSHHHPELELPGFEESDREAVIAEMCSGAVSYREIKDRDPWKALHQWLSASQTAALESYAPEKVTLSNGIHSRVFYPEDPTAQAWIEEKVQRLYEVKETPNLPGGALLQVKILAPNQRPWQVTSDLPGFWERGFTQMKKDLAGRYPKHEWR